jgi:hypothetical protein
MSLKVFWLWKINFSKITAFNKTWLTVLMILRILNIQNWQVQSIVKHQWHQRNVTKLDFHHHQNRTNCRHVKQLKEVGRTLLFFQLWIRQCSTLKLSLFNLFVMLIMFYCNLETWIQLLPLRWDFYFVFKIAWIFRYYHERVLYIYCDRLMYFSS